MENKPGPDKSPSRLPRISRRKAIGIGLGALGLAGVSVVDAHMGVATTVSATPEATPTVSKFPPGTPVEAVSTLPPVATPEAKPKIVEEVLVGKEKDLDLEKLKVFMNDFFSPEGIENLKKRGWFDEERLNVLRVSDNGKEGLVFLESEYNQPVGRFNFKQEMEGEQFNNESRDEFQISTDFESNNLKTFLKEVKPYFKYPDLDFTKEVFEPSDEFDPQITDTTMMDDVKIVQPEEPESPDDLRISQLFTHIPGSDKLHLEDGVHYSKTSQITLMPGNTIILTTVRDRGVTSSETRAA